MNDDSGGSPRTDGDSSEDERERWASAGLRVLLIGPTQPRGSTRTNVLGGNRVMMVEQQRELEARGFSVTTVDTSGAVTNLPAAVLASVGLLRFSRMTWQVVRKLRKCDVVCSIQRSKRLWDMGIALWVLCKLFRRPLILRVSGGRLGWRYNVNSGRLRRLIADCTFMRADIVYVETRAAFEALPRKDNLRYFPNTRQLPSHARRERTEPRRLLFLARIEPSKGLADCLEASRGLPESCTLSVYGPPTTGVDLADIERYPRATYRGVVAHSDLPDVLAEHDLMLMPTSFEGEGLPGVILEALQAAMPVISTAVGGIGQLVEHEVTGLVVEPRSVAELDAAIRRLIEDPVLYRRLCEGAARRGDEFRSDRWYDRFAADAWQLADRQQPLAGIAPKREADAHEPDTALGEQAPARASKENGVEPA